MIQFYYYDFSISWKRRLLFTVPETNIAHLKNKGTKFPNPNFQMLLLMEEILHHLGSIKPFHQQYISFRESNPAPVDS